MLPQYAGDATFAARFKQEAQAAAGLQSNPYIVGVYDWGKDGDTYSSSWNTSAARTLRAASAATARWTPRR